MKLLPVNSSNLLLATEDFLILLAPLTDAFKTHLPVHDFISRRRALDMNAYRPIRAPLAINPSTAGENRRANRSGTPRKVRRESSYMDGLNRC